MVSEKKRYQVFDQEKNTKYQRKTLSKVKLANQKPWQAPVKEYIRVNKQKVESHLSKRDILGGKKFR